MKLFLFVTLLGTALASPGGFTYSHSTAYGPLARNALAYGGFGHYSHEGPVTAYTANAPAFAGHVASYAAAPAFATYGAAAPAIATYGAAAPAVATYGAAAPAFATYAAAAPAVATYAAAAPAVATYATAAPAVATYATAAPAVASYATHAVAHAPVATYAAAAPVHAVAAPAAAVVPVTRLSAQPAVVQNVVDVAQPKLATRRFEIRRPAIQKQFYDVEERVVVRPAGSAVVELDTPIGANQRGPTQIRPAAPPVALNAYTSTHLATPTHHPVFPAGSFAIPAIPHHPAVVEQSQEVTQQIEQTSQIQQQPIPQQPIQEQPGQEQQFDDSDSVSVENPDISTRTQAPQRLPSPPFRSQLPDFPRAEATQLPQYQRGSLSEQLSSEGLPSFSRSRVTQYLQPEPLPEQQAQLTQASSARQQEASISFSRTQQQAVSSTPEVSPRLGPTPQPLQEEFDSRSFGAEVIPSVRNLSPEQSQANQARLIDLLTARGPVSEVRSASEPIRGRVLSATPAPPGSEPADERVNTRRIVVNRPIQTVQEVDVVQPFTKLERLAVHQPAVVKTAHLEYAAVPAVHTAFPAAVTVAPHYYKK